jgi:hypothetical protein
LDAPVVKDNLGAAPGAETVQSRSDCPF